MPENWSYERGNYWHAEQNAFYVAALDAKYTKELADAKAGNDALRGMMLPLVVVGCISVPVCRQCVKPPLPLSVDNAASPTGRHRWTGLFHLQREADHYAKTTEAKTSRSSGLIL